MVRTRKPATSDQRSPRTAPIHTMARYRGSVPMAMASTSSSVSLRRRVEVTGGSLMFRHGDWASHSESTAKAKIACSTP